MQYSSFLSKACLALLVCCALAFGAGTQANAQCSPAICDGVAFQNAFMDVELPGFPGCTVRYEYRWRVCGNPVVVTNIEVWSMSILGPPGPCTALETYFFPGTGVDWDHIEWGFREGYNAIVRKSFLATYNGLPPSLRSSLECPNGIATYTSSWRSCAQLLIYTYGPIGWPWPFRWRFQIRPCDDEICCTQETKVCYNKSTGVVEETHTWTYGNYGECGAPPPTPPNVWYASECLPWCVESR